jgi:hypothetical protein
MSHQLCLVQRLIDLKIDGDNLELFTSKLKGRVDKITCPFVVSSWQEVGDSKQQENQIYKITNHQLPTTNYQLYPKTLAAAAIPAPGVKLS